VIGTDREADRDDHADRSDRVDRSGRWNGVAAFALALLVASLIPVSWVVSDGTGGKRVGGTSDTGGGTGVEIVDALPSTSGSPTPPPRRLRDSGSPREPRDRSRPTGLFLAVGAAVAFGFGIELLQAPIRGGRSRGATPRSTRSGRSSV